MRGLKMTHSEYLEKLRPIIPEGEHLRFQGLQGETCIAWIEQGAVNYREFWSAYAANKWLKDNAK
jgi:hypothetical protein